MIPNSSPYSLLLATVMLVAVVNTTVIGCNDAIVAASNLPISQSGICSSIYRVTEGNECCQALSYDGESVEGVSHQDATDRANSRPKAVSSDSVECEDDDNVVVPL